MKKRELESELRSFFSLRKKVTPIVTRKDPLEEESSGPETTTRIPSPESRRKQKFVRNLSPKARRDIIKSKLSRETLYISPSDRIGSNYSHHAKFLTLRGGERKLSSPPRRSEIESEKDSMRNYLNIVRELSEDTNETFVNSMSQRIRQEPGQKDEIENEIRNGLAKAKVLYDLRSEDARHHHGIGTKLRHILLNKIDRDMSVIDREKSDKSIELRLERVCPTSREIERLWVKETWLETKLPAMFESLSSSNCSLSFRIWILQPQDETIPSAVKLATSSILYRDRCEPGLAARLLSTWNELSHEEDREDEVKSTKVLWSAAVRLCRSISLLRVLKSLGTHSLNRHSLTESTRIKHRYFAVCTTSDVDFTWPVPHRSDGSRRVLLLVSRTRRESCLYEM